MPGQGHPPQTLGVPHGARTEAQKSGGKGAIITEEQQQQLESFSPQPQPPVLPSPP